MSDELKGRDIDIAVAKAIGRTGDVLYFSSSPRECEALCEWLVENGYGYDLRVSAVEVRVYVARMDSPCASMRAQEFDSPACGHHTGRVRCESLCLAFLSCLKKNGGMA